MTVNTVEIYCFKYKSQQGHDMRKIQLSYAFIRLEMIFSMILKENTTRSAHLLES